MKRNRLLTVFLIVLLAMSLLTSCSLIRKQQKQDIQEDYHEINKLIKDKEFRLAYVEDDQICLYDKDRNLLEQIPLPDVSASFYVKYIEKKKNTLFFVQGGSVDDTWGLMIVNDDSDDLMQGLGSISRAGIGIYEFTTQWGN